MEPYLTVDSAAIVEICRFLRNSPGYRFEVLSDLTALDWPKEEKIQIVYHLFSYSQNHQIVLKVDLAARQSQDRDSRRSLESGKLVRTRGLRSVRRDFRRP